MWGRGCPHVGGRSRGGCLASLSRPARGRGVGATPPPALSPPLQAEGCSAEDALLPGSSSPAPAPGLPAPRPPCDPPAAAAAGAETGSQAPAFPHRRFLLFFCFPGVCVGSGRGGVLICGFFLVFFLFCFFLKGWIGFPHRHVVVFISARGRRWPAGHSPVQQYFLITCQKKKKKQPRSPVLPVCPHPCPGKPPARGPRNPGHYLTRLHGVALQRPRESRAVGFLLLSAILKTRNKRIFNEPPRRASACFVQRPRTEEA